MSDAFDVERLARTLERAIAHHCPEVLVAQRDDLVQKAVLRVTKPGRSLAQGRNISLSYLWRVAYCVVVDELRGTSRRREVSLDAAGSAVDRLSCEPCPETTAQGRELGRAIESSLERLSPSRRVAVLLHLQGHTNPEIAELLGWKLKRTENLVYRGLRDLRGHLQNKGVEP